MWIVVIDVVDVVFFVFVYYIEVGCMCDFLDCVVYVVQCCFGVYLVDVGMQGFVGCYYELVCQYIGFVDDEYVVVVVELVVFGQCYVDVDDVVFFQFFVFVWDVVVDDVIG